MDTEGLRIRDERRKGTTIHTARTRGEEKLFLFFSFHFIFFISFSSFSSFHTERRRTTNGLWKMATKKKGRIGSTLIVTTVQILLQQIVHRERDSQRHWKQLKMKDT